MAAATFDKVFHNTVVGGLLGLVTSTSPFFNSTSANILPNLPISDLVSGFSTLIFDAIKNATQNAMITTTSKPVIDPSTVAHIVGLATITAFAGFLYRNPKMLFLTTCTVGAGLGLYYCAPLLVGLFMNKATQTNPNLLLNAIENVTVGNVIACLGGIYSGLVTGVFGSIVNKITASDTLTGATCLGSIGAYLLGTEGGVGGIIIGITTGYLLKQDPKSHVTALADPASKGTGVVTHI